MSLQFITDNSGQPTAVTIPIKEWNDIRNKYPDVEQIEGELPNWQKKHIRYQTTKNSRLTREVAPY